MIAPYTAHTPFLVSTRSAYVLGGLVRTPRSSASLLANVSLSR